MTVTNMCSNFGGKWSRPRLKANNCVGLKQDCTHVDHYQLDHIYIYIPGFWNAYETTNRD